MHNLDDYNLDRLSREAAEQYEIPGKPSWEQLQQQLDKELPLKKNRRRRGFFFFVIITSLLAGAGAWQYLYFRQLGEQGPVAAYEKREAATARDEGAAVSPGGTGIKELHEKPGKQNSHAAIATPHSHETTNRDKAHPTSAAPDLQTRMPHQPAKAGTDAAQIVKNKLNITRLGHQGISSPGWQLKNSTAQRRSNISSNPNRHSPLSGNDPVAGDNGIVASEAAIAPAIAEKDTGSLAAATKRLVQQDSKAGKANSDSSGKAPDKRTPAAKGRGFSVAVTGGADFSTVKFTYGDKTGYTAGITGAWHFNSRWSVHTGALYTRKNYKLKGSDYNPPEHYWTQYVDLQSVEGYCRMWEVPVAARYSFPSAGSRQFFLSAGLSSYFMRKESYNYYYKLNNYTYERPWTNKTHLEHWFSILDLSAGVEKKINKRFSLEAEPYARIPLSGVGFGNIRLSSLGVNFSLRYRQPARH